MKKMEGLHHGTLLVDHYVTGNIESFLKAYYHNADFQRDLQEQTGNTDVVVGNWSNGNSIGSVCEIEYTMKAQIGVPKNRVYINMKYTTALPGEIYQIDNIINSPELPMVGKCFRVHERTIISQQKGHVRVTVSQEVDFFKKSLLKGVVKKSAKAEGLRFYSRIWTPFMQTSFPRYLNRILEPIDFDFDSQPQDENNNNNGTGSSRVSDLQRLARSRAFSIFIADTK
uniref:VASt domain-containing protein n=1 Tax=Aplanochytrium stocchinoi TaxID=215587 RepID=A0A6S8B8J8_9STRA